MFNLRSATLGDANARENEIGRIVVDGAVQIHQNLGPGLLESVYETVLAHELRKAGLSVECQVGIPVIYDHIQIEVGFRADIVVNDLVIIELKSVEELRRVHKKQVLTYLRLSKKSLGFLLNFGEELMKNGIHRISNGAPDWRE